MLSDLSPTIEGTVASGQLEFDCPLGHPHRIQIPIGAAQPRAWGSSGEFPESLTLTPSIVAHLGHPNDPDLRGDAWEAASKCGWHGFITNGAVTSV